MLHGRVVRPPAHGASVVSIDESSVSRMPGFVKLVRVADLVGVVCEREEQAISAAQAPRSMVAMVGLPDMKDLPAARNLPEFPSGYPKENPGSVLAKSGDVAGLANAAKVIRATYTSPYHHHGSIGPSCAVADVAPMMTTGAARRRLTARARRRRILRPYQRQGPPRYHEASGCYGQNGADVSYRC